MLREFWSIEWPERFAIVDLGPTDSYQATSNLVVCSYVVFEGFPFGPFSFANCEKPLWFLGGRAGELTGGRTGGRTGGPFWPQVIRCGLFYFCQVCVLALGGSWVVARGVWCSELNLLFTLLLLSTLYPKWCGNVDYCGDVGGERNDSFGYGRPFCVHGAVLIRSGAE